MARPGPAKEETVVVLPRGAPLAEITTLLSDLPGSSSGPWMFRLAIRVLGRDRDLKAGEYAFPAGISPSSVIGMLASGDTVARRHDDRRGADGGRDPRHLWRTPRA